MSSLSEWFGHVRRFGQERSQPAQLRGAVIAVDRVGRDARPLDRVEHVELVLAKCLRVRAIEAVERQPKLLLERVVAHLVDA